MAPSDFEIVCSYTRGVTRGSGGLYEEGVRRERETVLRTMILRCLEMTNPGCTISYDELVELTGEDASFLRQTGVNDCVRSMPPLPEGISWTPALVGWAYQVWNNPVRHAQSWGVSLKERNQAEHASVARLTQVFTDEYIADFITRRCFALSKKTNSPCKDGQGVSCCDPGCGVGHMLLSAIKNYQVAFPGACVSELRVYGSDIDPDAVELCRVLVFLEFLRQGFRGDRRDLWRTLVSSISVVDAPLGTLHRGHHRGREVFDILVTNPPYLGRRKMSGELRSFLDQEYPATRVDLAAAFLQRCVELTRSGGIIGFVTSDKWLRLRGYDGFRRGGGDFEGFLSEVALDVVCELGPRAFHKNTALHDGLRVSVVCGRKASPSQQHTFSYSNFSEVATYDEKTALFRRLSEPGDVGDICHEVTQAKLIGADPRRLFLEVGHIPNSLRVSPRSVGDLAHVVVGIQTNHDERFVRYVWQIPGGTPGWIPYSKGGGYRRWIGANHWLLDCREGFSRYARSAAGARTAEQWCARRGWSYSWLANGSLGLRLKESGWSFGRAASTGVFCEDPRLVAYLNSRVASSCVRLLGGKIQLPEGVTRALPVPASLDPISPDVIERIVEIKRLLVERDPTDIVYRPPTTRQSRDWRVLEALVALLEGCLEAQVEEALGLTYAESEDLDRRLGVPVGLLHIQDAASEEKFWSRVPEEYRALRSIVESVADRRRHSQKNTPGLSADSLSNALRGKGMRKGPWILPADGMVERLSRHFYINPIELVVAWEEVLEKNNSLGALERNESAHEKILEIVFEILGHRWWSSKEAKKRATVGSIDVYDVGAKVRRAGREIEEDLAIDLPLEDWLFDNFAAWTHRLFKGESPCIWLAGRGARGNTLIHRWDVQGAEAESLCHALER